MALILEINGTRYSLPITEQDVYGVRDSMKTRLASQQIQNIALLDGQVTVDWSNVATVAVFQE